MENWLRIWKTQGVGPISFHKIIDHYGSADHALRAGATAWIDKKLMKRMSDITPADIDINADLQWQEIRNHHIILKKDDAYPTLLRELPDAPPILYVIGNPALLNDPQLAIVGTRNPTNTGRQICYDFAADLARKGLAITSGLALGIDATAHEGTLDANGLTIAVMGTGLDRIYPAKHKPLAHRIVDQGGLLVSEFPIGTPPVATNFPRRNRIIAGLSCGLLVVEAAVKSGSLISATQANEAGREVFAIPGSIHSPQSKGCHKLIRDGAKLVESSDDILHELSGQLERILSYDPVSTHTNSENNVENTGSLDEEYIALLNCIDYDATAIDTIVDRSMLSIESVSSMLMILELNDWIRAEPGGFYQKIRSTS